MSIERVLNEVQNTPESIAQARRDLVAAGLSPEEADFEILIALGGSDTVETDEAGVAYYTRGDGGRVRVDSINWPKGAGG